MIYRVYILNYIHQVTLILTVMVLGAWLAWIQGAYLAGYAVYGFSLLLLANLTIWLYETILASRVRVNRHGLLLGVFGFLMFVFSYAMVPLYHIVCHGVGGEAAQEGKLYHPLELDIMVEVYRGLPIWASASVKHIQLNSYNTELVMIDLYNQSNQAFDLRLTTSSSPRTLKPAFDLVYPQDIHLRANSHIRFPVEIKFHSSISDELWQSALLFLFQDTKDVGKLGQAKSWTKMQSNHFMGDSRV